MVVDKDGEEVWDRLDRHSSVAGWGTGAVPERRPRGAGLNGGDVLFAGSGGKGAVAVGCASDEGSGMNEVVVAVGALNLVALLVAVFRLFYEVYLQRSCGSQLMRKGWPRMKNLSKVPLLNPGRVKRLPPFDEVAVVPWCNTGRPDLMLSAALKLLPDR